MGLLASPTKKKKTTGGLLASYKAPQKSILTQGVQAAPNFNNTLKLQNQSFIPPNQSTPQGQRFVAPPSIPKTQFSAPTAAPQSLKPNIKTTSPKMFQGIVNAPGNALGTINRFINPAMPQNAPRNLYEQFGQAAGQVFGGGIKSNKPGLPNIGANIAPIAAIGLSLAEPFPSGGKGRAASVVLKNAQSYAKEAKSFLSKSPPLKVIQLLEDFRRYNDFGTLPDYAKKANITTNIAFENATRNALQSWIPTHDMTNASIAKFATHVEEQMKALDAKWTGTKSLKPSTAVDISISKKPSGKEGGLGRTTSTSGPFDTTAPNATLNTYDRPSGTQVSNTIPPKTQKLPGRANLNSDLTKEAEKYTTFEEFKKAVTGNQGIYDKAYDDFIQENRLGAKPYDYELYARAFGSNAEIKGDLVKVYRLTDNGRLLPGDNVSIYDVSKITNKDTISKMGYGELLDSSNHKLVAQWIPKKDLYITDAGTHLYAPDGTKSLTDFFNKVKGGTPKGGTPFPGREGERGFINPRAIAESIANIGKAAPEAKPSTAERAFIASVKEFAPEISDKVSGQYIPRSTDKLAVAAKNLIKDDIFAAEKIAKTGTDDKAAAVASELIKKYTSDAAKASDEGTKAALYDKAAEIANEAAKNLTEAGRTVQAASILGRLTPEGQVRFAAKEIQRYNESVAKAKQGTFGTTKQHIPELSGEQAKDILEEAKRIQDMPDGIDKAIAFKKLQNKIADLVPTPLYKKLITVWKAGLLTGLKTSGLNDLSNLFHGVSEFAKDIPAAAVDSVAALFSGKRTLALTAKGTMGGVQEGFGKGWTYLKTGYSERDIGKKLDYTQVSFGTSPFGKAIQAYEETVFKVIGAQDQPFYYGAKARSLYSQAIAMVKNEGLKGTDADDFIEHLIKNPTDEMLKYATVDAETAVFQNKVNLAKVGKGIQQLGGGLGEIIVPFNNTPSSVAMQIVNYSPAGLIKPATRLIAAIKTGTFDQRLFSQEVGRALTGTGIAYLGTLLYNHDLISLSFPTDEATRKQWELEGRKANSIKILGKWRNVNVLGPAGPVMVAGGHFAKGLKDTGSITQALAQAAAGAGKSYTESTFLKSVNTLIDAITDPQRSATNFFSGLIGSIVPTIVSDVARGTDDKERRTPGFTGRLKSRIPGLREKLEPQVDTFGAPIETPSFLTTMLDPTRPTQSRNDPVVDELRRLMDVGHKVTPTQLGDREGYDDLTPEQNTELWERAGQLLHTKLDFLIENDKYHNLDDEQKAKTIKDFTDKAKRDARAEMVLEMTQDKQGDELMKELARLKKAGLLTKEVFKRYQELR